MSICWLARRKRDPDDTWLGFLWNFDGGPSQIKYASLWVSLFGWYCEWGVTRVTPHVTFLGHRFRHAVHFTWEIVREDPS